MAAGPDYQVKQLLTPLARFGQSKYDAKQALYNQAKTENEAGTSKYIAEHTGIYSYETFNKYFEIIRNVFTYSREHYGIKTIDKVSAVMVNAFLKDKLSETQKGGTIGQYKAAIVKMAVAMDLKNNYEDRVTTKAFNIAIADAMKDVKLEHNKENRAYNNPYAVIQACESEKSKIALNLTMETGMRVGDCTKIRPEQLNGQTLDWRSKGGFENSREISKELADKLREYFKQEGSFYLKEHQLRADVKQACEKVNETYEGKGIHGFRYNFTQETVERMLSEGYSKEEAHSHVSELLSHHREDITERYLK
jgi:integrase